MKTSPMVPCLAALALGACGGVERPPAPLTFDAEDASYELGERLDATGELVNVEVLYDRSASYLTPQSPATSWIVDRAAAHTQQRSLLLREVEALALYVRRCRGGGWVNVASTPFAADAELLQGVFDGQYVLGHYYGNIQTNVLLDPELECQSEPADLATVVIDGDERRVQRVGDVEFAFVVEHRE